MFCMRCGNPVADNAKFCTKCGCPVESTASTAPAEAAAPAEPAAVESTVEPEAAVELTTEAEIETVAVEPEPEPATEPVAPEPALGQAPASEYAEAALESLSAGGSATAPVEPSAAPVNNAPQMQAPPFAPVPADVAASNVTPPAAKPKKGLMIGIVAGVAAVVLIGAFLLIPRLIGGSSGPVYVPVKYSLDLDGDGKVSTVGEYEVTIERADDGTITHWTRNAMLIEGETLTIDRDYTYEDGFPTTVDSTSQFSGDETSQTNPMETTHEINDEGFVTAETWEGSDWVESYRYTYDDEGQLKSSKMESEMDGESNYQLSKKYRGGMLTTMNAGDGDYSSKVKYDWDVEAGTMKQTDDLGEYEFDVQTDDAGNIVSMVGGEEDASITVEWVKVDKPCGYAQFESLNKTPWM
ncbi:Predicted membrane protein [Slackia heliotrinireducens]|uniref:Zinc-ribbon domain-containing protein n=1 Tax=Slackia heliotrinireducens (strain ATCC 29202 / DSM 20476 / NCTC 11029 / RHS 1) TaxID=471855 RepID=C7N459_SLAHD|nr:zinc ribbon domain-containing protein [Slackia heliotrinireducens]ACV23795.1 hypothetical protein Shel_28040 [Slackia heliotrinireducens DSM 20476]VEH03461.1 Predicted membrane protein [Slackia heliotrinireducens]